MAINPMDLFKNIQLADGRLTIALKIPEGI